MTSILEISEGERLRNYLRISKIGQVEFAKRLNMTRQNLNLYFLKEILPDDFKERLKELEVDIYSVPFVNEGGELYGKGEGKLINIGDLKIMNVPLINQYAYAGYLRGYKDNEWIENLPRYPWIADREYKGNYISIEVRGDSMDDGSSESILDGDILLCREIKHELWESKLHINKWAFVIVHKDEGILIKRIIAHDTSTHTITLHSLNPNYENKTVILDNVKQLFNVVKFERGK